MVLFAVYLAQVRVYSEPATMPRRGVTPLVITFMHKRRVAEVLLDVCLVAIAYYGAWRLRFEGAEWQAYLPSLLQSLPIALGVQMTALYVFGAYRGAWRYFGLMDGVAFGKAVVGGTVCLIAAIVYVYRFDQYSRGVFIIYAALLMLLLCGSRASFRLIGEFAHRRRPGMRLAIYGAGGAGSLLVRELLGDPHEQYQMVGFIDDDPATHAMRLQGYPVLGGQRRLIELLESGQLDVVVIDPRGLDRDRIETVWQACRAHEVRLLSVNLHVETLVPSA
jgi:UDP-GlcNAc:undecaprenyl-phosphate GlcNAc-1-phosphate transferase